MKDQCIQLYIQGKMIVFRWFFVEIIFLSNQVAFGNTMTGMLQSECGNTDRRARIECGHGGIHPQDCIRRGCCYLATNTPAIPWCFLRNASFLVASSQYYDVTTAATTTRLRQETPEWIKKLLKVSLTFTEAKKSNLASTGSASAPSAATLMAEEIEDELTCQKTYRLFKKLNGNDQCMMDPVGRVSCVIGELPKKIGESECSACTKLDCCYDPIARRHKGFIAPHCYKARIVMTTTTATSSTAPKVATVTTTLAPKKIWPNIRPAFQPGQAPPSHFNPTTSSKRLQQLLNQIRFSQTPIRGTSLTSNRGFFPANTIASQVPFYSSQGKGAPPPAFLPGKFKSTFSRPESSSTSPGIVDVAGPLYPPSSAPSSQMTALLNRYNSVSSLLYPSNSHSNIGNTPKTNFLNYFLKKKAGLIPTVGKGVSNPLNLLSALKPSASDVTSTSSDGPGPLPAVVNLMTSLRGSVEGETSTRMKLLKYLLNRNRPTQAPAPPSSGKSENPFLKLLLKKLSQITSQNQEVPIKNPIRVPKTSVAYKEKNKIPIVPLWSKVGKQKYVSSIPVLFETTNFAHSRTTCYPTNCGWRSTDGGVSQRIVGGQWSGGIEYWPWTVSLRRAFTDDDRFIHICGATLISKRWIVTAGHCFTSYAKRGKKILGQKEKHVAVYRVHAGQYYRFSDPEVKNHNLESFQPHPKFDFKSLTHDIAVAKLKGSVTYSNQIQPACLPHKDDVLLSGDRCWVAGWGETMHVGNQNRSKLKELSLPLIPTSTCQQSWPRHFHEAWICTEGAYLEDACAGDSGGPLMKRNRRDRWDLIGVAIAGTKTCSTQRNDIKPGIYTKVAYFRDFIDTATGGACDETMSLEKSAT